MSGDRKDRWPWLLGVGLVLAAALRIPGLGTELWMDEILSLRSIDSLRSPLGVFTAIHTDNNHYLNSLWLWSVGDHAPWWLMRLPPLVLGIAVVAVAYRIARSRGRTAAVSTAALFALSYPLINYSSEARGYGYVALFTLLAFGAFRVWQRGGGTRYGVAYGVCASLAFLSHLAFITVFAAFLIWSGFDVLRSRGARARQIVRHASVHALPAAILALLYVVDVRHMVVLGGPPITVVRSWLSGMGLLAGGAPGFLAGLVAGAAALAVGTELVRDFRRGDTESLFFAFAILLPLMIGVVASYGAARYYLISLLFALLLLGRFLAMGLESKTWRASALVLFLGFTGVNVLQTARFATTGRGRYLEALTDMAASATRTPVSVAGSHDLGNVLVVDYYSGLLPEPTAFVYRCHPDRMYMCSRSRPSRAAGELPPEFYLKSFFTDRFSAEALISVSDLGDYEFVRSYPKYGLSGIAWALYRLSASTSAP